MDYYSDFRPLGIDPWTVGIFTFGALTIVFLSLWINVVQNPLNMLSNPRNIRGTKRYFAPAVALGFVTLFFIFQLFFLPGEWRLYIPNATHEVVTIDLNGKLFEIEPDGFTVINVMTWGHSLDVKIRQGEKDIYATTLLENGAYIGNCTTEEIVTAREIVYAVDNDLAFGDPTFQLLREPGVEKFNDNPRCKVYEFDEEPPSSISVNKGSKQESRYQVERLPKGTI